MEKGNLPCTILLLLVSFVNTLLANTLSLDLFGTLCLDSWIHPNYYFFLFQEDIFKQKNGVIFKVRLFKPRKSYSQSCNSLYSNILILIHFFLFGVPNRENYYLHLFPQVKIKINK